MNKPRLAIAGCGYWGQHLIRNFSEVKDIEVRAVCDCDLNALARVKRRYPDIELQRSFEDLLSDSRIDAIVIATPLATHYPFARQALLAGKHVLVEKPLATSSEQVSDLIDLAAKKRRVLMVDHTFVYTGAVRRMKALIDQGEIGQMLYFDSVRISLGLVQSDVNVLWDLGPHDLSVMNHLCARDPVAISAIGVKHLGCSFENISYVSAFYDDNLVAHFHFNWLAPVKIRKTLVGGSKRMIVYDDMEASEKVKVYGKSITMSHDAANREKLLSSFQNGDMVSPNLETGEALQVMARDFTQAVLQQGTPVSDGLAGYRVVRMLEAAQLSMTQNGRPVQLTSSAASSTVGRSRFAEVGSLAPQTATSLAFT